MPEQVTAPENAAAPDQAARDRITEDLDTTLFVEAGAGSGQDLRPRRAGAGPGERWTGRAPPCSGHYVYRKGRSRAARSHPGGTREGGRGRSPRRGREALPGGPGPARRGGHRHAALLCPAPALRTPGGGRPPAPGRGTRRGQFDGRLRRPLVVISRSTPGRPLSSSGPCCSSSPPASGPRALQSLAEAFDDNWDLVQERVPEAAPEPPAGS